jgi:hypothetical protein
MNKYLEYLKRVWADLIKLPPAEFDKRMKEISSPVVAQYIEARPIFSGEPIVYCNPTPRAWALAAKAAENLEDEK